MGSSDPLFSDVFLPMNLKAIMGTSVRETTREAASEKATVMAWSLKICPAIP